MAKTPERERLSQSSDADEGASRTGTRNVEQKLASGRPASTPFALTGIVALVLWAAAAIVAAVLFLVIWLA